MSLIKFFIKKNEEEVVANGNVKITDNTKNLNIFANKIIYFKNSDQIKAIQNVLLQDNDTNTMIKANEIKYSKNEEIFHATGNVKLNEFKRDIVIETNEITYKKKLSKISTKGKTKALIHSKYKFNSKNLIFLKNKSKLISSNKTEIEDDGNSSYVLDSFEYQINTKFLKGTNIKIIEDITLPLRETNRLFFKNAFLNLEKKDFKSSETKISLRKNIFDRSENDPRLYGVSSTHKNGITSVKKAVFTSCKKTDKCPPWRIEASKIKHDKNKKQLIYDNSILKIYDLPIFYFPKFFHPDPTVERQSGILIPKLNNSNVLGSSISVPYFHVISENKDFTFIPTIFSKNTLMLQNEYRLENKSSSLNLDFGIVHGFKSSETQKKKNINHIFSNFKTNLNLDKFTKSDLNIFLERVSKDTYLKIFSANLSDTKYKPKNPDILNSGFDIDLESNKFSLKGGIDIYEDLRKQNSDRYQFVLPYYDFSRKPISFNKGTFNFISKGNYTLDNTNQAKSKIINDFQFKMNDKIFDNIGLKNNLNFYLKNLNSLGKNIETYKSSPQIEFQSLIEFNSELPLTKITKTQNQTLIPRLSLRLNPGDMKNHTNDERKINAKNIFNLNRIGIDDSFEAGNSLTLGIDFKTQNENEENKYLEFKLATVFRDNENNYIPLQTTLNKRNSNLFGSAEYNISDNFNIDYNFSIDNKLQNFDNNSIGLNLSLNNFVTEFNFIEERGVIGSANVFENITKYNFDDQNSISFKTRRNREINLTEYYNLVYEYKNDCLTAGIRFNKTYYEDRDLKPSENIMFTISFFPLTTIEQSLE